MNRLLFILLGFAVHFNIAFSQGSEFNNYTKTLQLRNGYFVQIQVCSKDIFRVRLSSNGDFVGSLLERYQILNNNWGNIRLKVAEDQTALNLSTDKVLLTVNKDQGEMVLKDIRDDRVISSINPFLNDQRPKFNGFIRSLAGLPVFKIIPKEVIGDTSSISGKNKFERNRITEEKIKDLTDSSSVMSLVSFNLSKTERFYGLGSASRDRIQHRGTALRIWPQYQQSESPFPFIMSSEGWGVFFNTTRVSYFDVGKYDSDKMMVYCSDPSVDFFLMTGSMPEMLDQYTSITGKPYLLPKWAYGLAFGSNTLENELNILENAYHFRQENIPCDIYWIEPQWMEKYYDSSTKKNWDPQKFYNAGKYFWESSDSPKKEIKPDLFIHRMNAMGFKLALWLNATHDLSLEEEDYLAAIQGKPLSGQEHWFPHLLKFVNQGIQGFKLDPGTTMDEHPTRKYYNGLTDKEMHPVNQVLLPKQLYRTFRENTGLRSFHHYCGGYSGIQHWSASTSGDNGGGPKALFDQLNLGMSGVPNTSCDVLFLENNEPVKQGMHFGFFLPWVQVNSWYGILHPWFYSPEEKKSFQFYDQLRYSLVPYIYSAAINSSLTGMPVLRAMPLIYPNDANLENETTQYMFGDYFLVSVFSDKTYLPEGNWIDYWTGRKYTGNQVVVSTDKIHGGPLFIKAGAIIPFQKPAQYIGGQNPDTLVVKIYPYGQSSYQLLEDDGTTFNYEKGEILKTNFRCKAEPKLVTVEVTREGAYTGMPENKVYELEIESALTPRKVMVNNLAAAHWRYSNGKILLSVVQKKEPLSITLNY